MREQIISIYQEVTIFVGLQLPVILHLSLMEVPAVPLQLFLFNTGKSPWGLFVCICKIYHDSTIKLTGLQLMQNGGTEK